jgi:hypothetical protein
MAIAFSALAAQGLHAAEEAETGFEAPAYEEGKSVHGVNGWKLLDGQAETDEATVTAVQSFGGTQSLEIGAGSAVERVAVAGDVAFYDLELLPKYAEGEQATRLSFYGGILSFEKHGSLGRITVFSGTGGDVVVRDTVPLEGEDGWLRVTARVDTKKKEWDLFLDGKPVKGGLPLAESQGAFQIEASPAGSVFLDDYLESSENPLFEDADKDAFADAEEWMYGLNPSIDDRNGDVDGNGIRNVEEIFAGSAAKLAGLAENSVIFVDNLSGDDANNGKTSQIALGANGPKASIKAAMAAAASGATIVVTKGKGVYVEGSRNAKGKKLTIKTVAPVTIK